MFTKGRDNLDMILSNQRDTYNKSSQGYQLDINVMSLQNICLAKKKTNHTIFK